MKSAFIGLLVLASALTSAFGAEKTVARQTNFHWILGPQMTLVGNTFGLGGNVDAMYEFNPGMMVGLESGVSFLFTSPLAVQIPLLPTFLYFIPTKDPGFHPVVGASIGPSIFVGSGFGGLAAGAAFNFRAHLSMAFSANRNMFFDLKFGVVANAFELAPAFNFFL
jgi:hypothetical protein